MTRPLVSVVIPAYNHERFIGAAVESVLQQSCSDLELIVVNDGSTDSTGDIVQGYSDKRLHYFFQENQDAYNTINRGLELAEGRYLAILNSDDVFPPNRLEKLLGVCRRENAVCTFSDVIPIDDDDQPFTDPEFGWNVWHRKNREFFFSSRDLLAAFLKGNFMVTTSNLFMTAEAAKHVGAFAPLRYLHDYDFILRMIAAYPNRVHYAADLKLLYYRIHPGNTLGEAAIIGREQDRDLIKKHMLAAIPEKYRKYVEAGSERLVELEMELVQARRQLHHHQPQGVRPALKQLRLAVRTWVAKQIG